MSAAATASVTDAAAVAPAASAVACVFPASRAAKTTS